MNTFTWLCVVISSLGVSLVFCWSVIDFRRLKNKFGRDPGSPDETRDRPL